MTNDRDTSPYEPEPTDYTRLPQRLTRRRRLPIVLWGC